MLNTVRKVTTVLKSSWLSSYIQFLQHRFYRPKMLHFSRILTSDTTGKDLFCLADDEMVTHNNWKDDTHLVAWARQYGLGDHYFLFTDKTQEKEILGKGKLIRDGHMSYSPDGRWLLTDTYPNAYNICDRSSKSLSFSFPFLRLAMKAVALSNWKRVIFLKEGFFTTLSPLSL